MPLFSFEGVSPTVHPDAWIAPTATLVGDVHVEADASIWYNAVLRADFGRIIVREGANVQDGSVLHGGDDPITEVDHDHLPGVPPRACLRGDGDLAVPGDRHNMAASHGVIVCTDPIVV